MARNIATAKLVQVSGLKELQDNLAGLIDRMDGEELQAGLKGLAIKGAQMLEERASSQGWPKRAIESIFVFGKISSNTRKQKGPSSLFGFRKRGRSQPWAPGYAEWMPRNTRGRGHAETAREVKRIEGQIAKRTVAAGARKIGESLATMYEFGTAKLRPRPAMRPVIAALKAIYPDEVGKLLQKILDKHRIGAK